MVLWDQKWIRVIPASIKGSTKPRIVEFRCLFSLKFETTLWNPCFETHLHFHDFIFQVTLTPARRCLSLGGWCLSSRHNSKERTRRHYDDNNSSNSNNNKNPFSFSIPLICPHFLVQHIALSGKSYIPNQISWLSPWFLILKKKFGLNMKLDLFLRNNANLSHKTGISTYL